jgi:hypothetical protein
MPLLWVRTAASEQWQAMSLDGTNQAVYLAADAARPVVAADVRHRPKSPLGHLLKHDDRGGHENWVLLAGEDSPIRVNGEPASVCVHAMRHGDELRLGPGLPVVVFSAEHVAAVETYDEDPAGVPCARCGQPVTAGSPAVRCAHCRAWFHQTDKLPCYTYDETCSRCRQPISLEGEPQWLPEAL